jgi:hypothetical protein
VKHSIDLDETHLRQASGGGGETHTQEKRMREQHLEEQTQGLKKSQEDSGKHAGQPGIIFGHQNHPLQGQSFGQQNIPPKGPEPIPLGVNSARKNALKKLLESMEEGVENGLNPPMLRSCAVGEKNCRRPPVWGDARPPAGVGKNSSITLLVRTLIRHAMQSMECSG